MDIILTKAGQNKPMKRLAEAIANFASIAQEFGILMLRLLGHISGDFDR